MSVVLVFNVFRVLCKGSVGRAAVIAAIFAVHPLGAETVSWVSERKGVLCGTLFLSALYVYVAGPRTTARLLATSALYLAALMAKPMALTLPFVLLLLDAWPLGDFSRRRVLEKLPMLALAAVISVVTVGAQDTLAATVDSSTFPFSMRLENAVVSAVEYLRLFVVPLGLSAFYPHPYGQTPAWQVAASVALLVAVTVIFVTQRKERPHLLVGWLWWLGMLVPVIGLKQIGRWAMADHYMYLPLLGLTFAAVTELGNRLKPMVAAGGAGVAVLALSVLAYQQCGYWHDTRRLFEHAVEVTAGPNWMAEQLLGELDAQRGDYTSSEQHFRAAIAALEHDPPMRARVWATLLTVLDVMPGGRAAEVAAVEARARAAPDDAIAQYDLGVAYEAGQRWDEAAAVFRRVLELTPDYVPARERLDETLKAKGRVGRAP
ncbi:MAG: tetratricopeptide repeat protein [Archangiaceae bacterium]|nr:tetratricopeptide repeat protein [Archangiaceae bacterium]